MPGADPASVIHPPYYRRHAVKLHENGWRVFPAYPGTKQPAVEDWTRYCREAPSLEQVLAWSASPIAYGILLACGCGNDGVCYGAIDLDEDDPERAAELFARTQRIFGETPLVRIGQPQRRVLLFALSPDAAATRRFRAYNVEIIADGGCVVLYGTHPLTAKPYAWEGLSPEDVPAWDLP